MIELSLPQYNHLSSYFIALTAVVFLGFKTLLIPRFIGFSLHAGIFGVEIVLVYCSVNCDKTVKIL